MSFKLRNLPVVLAALFLISCLPTAVRADIVRSSNGAPVLSSDGNCVLNNWEGAEKCDEAKAGTDQAPMETQKTMQVDQERVVYFDFNKATLTPRAKQHLDRLARKIHWMNKRSNGVSAITIVGFADRIGHTDYNQKLAMKRAQAVHAYLVGKGVTAEKIDVRSLGKTEPMADCPADLPRAKLIECLKEDRRAEIEISTRD